MNQNSESSERDSQRAPSQRLISLFVTSFVCDECMTYLRSLEANAMAVEERAMFDETPEDRMPRWNMFFALSHDLERIRARAQVVEPASLGDFHNEVWEWAWHVGWRYGPFVTAEARAARTEFTKRLLWMCASALDEAMAVGADLNLTHPAD